MGFPGDSEDKESACNEGDLFQSGLGRSSGGGHSNPLQYSCLENPHEQKNLAAYNPWGGKELDTTEQLSIAQHHHANSSFGAFHPTPPVWAGCL